MESKAIGNDHPPGSFYLGGFNGMDKRFLVPTEGIQESNAGGR